MPGSRCYKVIWSLAPIIAILAMVLSSGSQSDLQYDSIVTYPTGDYLSWSTGNDIPWTIDFENGYNDKSSLKSGPIECAGASRLMMDMPGPAIIRFKWKTDSPSGIGQLLFKVDSNKTFECQSRDWTEFSYPLGPGATHKLEWCYRRIKSYPQWAGAGWIDDVNAIQMGQYANAKYNTKLTGSISQRNESESKWDEPKNDSDIMSERHPDVITDVLNGTLEAPQIPNITVVIENIEFTPKNIACAPSEDIIVNSLSPKDGETFLNNSLIKFKYIPNGSGIINNCTLFIDDEMENSKRNIKVNKTNEIIIKRRFTEEGPYEWNVRCCDCGTNCNSTGELIFKIAEKNETTYVNQTYYDDSRFIFENITYAITRTEDDGQVVVYHGDYTECVKIEKPISIIGIDWPVIVSKYGNNAVEIKANKINVSGLNVTGGDCGIFIGNETKELRDVRVFNNHINLSSSGIKADSCYNCEFIGNNISDCKTGYPVGIELINCRDCIISSNRINENHATNEIMKACINPDRIYTNVIRDNIFGHSTNGIWIKDLEGKTTEEIEQILKNNNNRFIQCASNVTKEA